MRVLAVAGPMAGHVLPLAPLALALQAAGDEVRVATAAGGVVAARRAGLAAVDVTPGLDMRRIGFGTLARHPVHVARLVQGDERLDGVGAMFAAVNASMLDGVLELADTWAPDLVLHEGLMPAGVLAASRHVVPAVLVDGLVSDGCALFRAVASRMAGPVRRRGLGPLAEPDEVVTTAPPSLVGSRRGRSMRHVATATGAVSGGAVGPAARARILVTRSTADDPRRDRMMSTVVAAARGADLDVVLVRPDRWVSRRPLPANVRGADWLPFAQVFPCVAGVVHHGGSGTTLTALAAGVPQLVVPGAGDRRLHARLLVARGAGLGVPLERLDRAALEQLVNDASLRQAAREVAEEIAGMPHPREIVGPLRHLAGRPGRS